MSSGSLPSGWRRRSAPSAAARPDGHPNHVRCPARARPSLLTTGTAAHASDSADLAAEAGRGFFLREQRHVAGRGRRRQAAPPAGSSGVLRITVDPDRSWRDRHDQSGTLQWEPPTASRSRCQTSPDGTTWNQHLLHDDRTGGTQNPRGQRVPVATCGCTEPSAAPSTGIALGVSIYGVLPPPTGTYILANPQVTGVTPSTYQPPITGFPRVPGQLLGQPRTAG